MSPEITQAILTTCEAVSGVALGGVLAVIITHRLNIDRERISGIQHRKRAFLAFMAGWRYEIGRVRLADGGGGFEGREETFGNIISAFVQHANLIKWDFHRNARSEFDGLCSAITSIKHPTVYSPSDRAKAQKMIDDIMAFVERYNK